MKAKNLSQLAKLDVPRTQSELTWALSGMARGLGASRFSYIQLPMPLRLVEYGVRPKILTSFPDELMRSYYRSRAAPFAISRHVIETRQFLRMADSLEGGLQVPAVWLEARERGFGGGYIFPVDNSPDTVFIYGFDGETPESPDFHYKSEAPTILELVRVATKGEPNLLPDFGVPGLTAQRRKILLLKTEGYTNEGIAEKMGVKPDSVKKAVSRLSAALGGMNTTEIIYHLAKLGLI